jgi:aryl-alcohol dehydrogenase-like predicted oxidoreductase
VIPRVVFGRTGIEVTRIALGGYPFGGVNRARGWDPFTAEGRREAIATVHAALDAGITVVDTAPSYGGGNSESIVGEATDKRRAEFTLMTKVGYRGATPRSVVESVESSLKRLRTSVIDVIQFHGGMYTDDEVDLILNGGLLDALEQLRDRQLVRFVGFTVEEPWTARPLIASGRFDCVQICFNLIYQSAARHALSEAREAGLGVSVMRPMTSGMFQRIAHYLAPEWDAARGLYEVALKFVLSDSRVHVANVGMRSPEEVTRNVALAEAFVPPFDMAELPRSTADIYRTDDEMHADQKDDHSGR